jgi:uncharacterized protein (TIGR02421 family)
MLPLDGRLHIDRQLPFLVIYRQPLKREDEGTRRLVIGEASYLIASGDKQLKPSLSALIHNVVTTLVEKFNTFLIIEIWAAPENRPKPGTEPPLPKPAFRIITSKTRLPTTTVETLDKSLKRIRVLKQAATVEVDYSKKRSPAGLPMLISAKEARQLNCFVLGLEIQPVYRNPITGELFPLVLRTLHHGLAGAFKRAFFEFSRTQTSYTPPSHHALGRRAVVKAVWDIDRRLAEISSSFDFLLQVTPVNVDRAWVKFKRRRFERMPVLYYRPLPIDPALLKGKLYRIPLNRVEDPTLAFLFRQKRVELDRQLTMLNDRGTKQFLYGSLQLSGGVSDELRQLAEEILHKISPRSRENSGGKRLNAKAFAQRASAEIEYYRHMYPDLSAKVQIRDDTVGLMVSQGNLLVGRQTKIPQSRVEALLQHEVGTHVLTYFNGQAQPFQQLYTGLAGYEELQEGVAVLAEYLVGGLSPPRLRLLAGRVVATHCLIDGASFVETFRELNKTYGFKQKTAFTITVRIYRSGGLAKDAVYLRGLVGVLKYIKEGGELDPLFIGKIAATHIPIIQELQSRQVLHPAPLYPRYMDIPQTAEKLERLRSGVSVLDLIERRKN